MFPSKTWEEVAVGTQGGATQTLTNVANSDVNLEGELLKQLQCALNQDQIVHRSACLLPLTPR